MVVHRKSKESINDKTREVKRVASAEVKSPKEWEFPLPEEMLLLPEFYVLLLSNGENLQVCREHATPGFPEEENGCWAFQGIEAGNYATIYHSYYSICLVQGSREAHSRVLFIS